MMVPMRFIASFALMFFFIIPYAHAEVKTLNEIAVILEAGVRAGDIKMCSQYSTKRSQPYIKRLISYKFQQFIPQSISYSAVPGKGGVKYVSASTHQGDKETFVKLAFIKEDNQWKFDFPHSMKQGFGDDWEQKLAELEQFYLMMQQAQ